MASGRAIMKLFLAIPDFASSDSSTMLQSYAKMGALLLVFDSCGYESFLPLQVSPCIGPIISATACAYYRSLMAMLDRLCLESQMVLRSTARSGSTLSMFDFL